MTIAQPVLHIFRPVVDEAARSLYEMCLPEVHAPMGTLSRRSGGHRCMPQS